jgi:nucleotide-binding universal stress UspA family protein
MIARTAGVECRLVHAARDVWADLAVVQVPEHVESFRRSVVDSARNQIRASLSEVVPEATLDHLVVKTGWPPAVLDDEVKDTGAELLVLGAKHHSALGRWLGGSTVQNVVRMLRTPLLVTGAPPGAIRRVLVAVDLSYAAAPTLDAARRYADLFKAELRVLHTIEPLPILPEAPPPPSLQDYEELLEDELKQKIWPLVRDPAVHKLLRHGSPELVIAAEAKAWQADLVVVGSHGKGWVDRMLLGSITERVLQHLPAPTLVVPVGRPPTA